MVIKSQENAAHHIRRAGVFFTSDAFQGHPFNGSVFIIAQTMIVGRVQISRQRRVAQSDTQLIVDAVRHETKERHKESHRSAIGHNNNSCGGGGRIRPRFTATYRQFLVATSLWRSLRRCRYCNASTVCSAMSTMACVVNDTVVDTDEHLYFWRNLQKTRRT